ncbi:MAG: VWA domain-containing protein [Minisyncoccia bacterium]
MNQTHYNKGFIALMATIIISLVLLVMAVNESSSGWSARFNILGTEAKEQATALAEGCAEQALATLLTDPTYTGNATTTTADGTCHIFPVQFNFPIAGLVTIKTQGIVRGSYANLDMAMEMNDLHFGSIPTAPTTGTLFITTLVVNDGLPAGTSQAGNFTMSVSANPSSSFSGSETGVAVVIQPGAYSVSEVLLLPNYTKTAGPDCSGNIVGGEIKFCTITYNDVTTTLTLLANVTNNDSGSSPQSAFPLFIDGVSATLGQAYPVSAGNHTASATTLSGYAASPWGYDCDSTGGITMLAGQNKTCIINFDDAPPPSPICAETVMMLDRTGSMTSSDLVGERAAANALLDLYDNLTPLPKSSIGVFAALGSGQPYVASILQSLTTTYANLYNAVTTGLASSAGGTNIASAIDVSRNELVTNGTVGKPKVLILVSDGEANWPTSGATPVNTGWKSPTANAQDSSGELWSSPTGAYTNGGTDATDPVSENDQHRYSSFNFPTVPSNANITGLEVSLDAWATTTAIANTPTNVAKSPTLSSTPNQWTNPNNAFTSNDTYTTSVTNGNQQGYGNFGFSIPSNATITGIQVTTEAKVSGGSTSISTATLLPDGQGSDSSWNGSESDVDESGTPSCSSGDRIDSNNSGNRESVDIDLSSIPNGSTITSVQVLTWDQGSSGGQYQDFVSIGGTRTNSATITVTSIGGCNARTQTIDIPDFIKSGSSDLDVGVQKVGNTNVQVGAIRTVITYIPASTGTLAIALSSNNGGAWTSVTRNVSVDTIESVDMPSGNSTTDLWGRTWTPANFNNGNFLLRVQNNSTTGTTVSLDQVIVNVFYTSPAPAPVACQIGVQMWSDDDNQWSSEQTQTLSNTETTYILGDSTDDWNTSWDNDDFINSNFLMRVRAIDPGSGCDNSSVDHLDFLQARIHYTLPADPLEAALVAADTAKLAGINIFTIHFGSDPAGYEGKELLANLASGSSPVSYNSLTHQNGSVSDAGGLVSGNTGTVSPTLETTDTGGDGNGFEMNPTGAFSDGNGNASNINGDGDRHRYYGYNFTIPPNATITGIATRLDWWLDSTSNTNSMDVQLSWNGGTSWSSTRTSTDESTSSGNSDTVGGSTDNWGRTWATTDFSTTNFRVRLTSHSSSGSRDFFLDWVPVTIYYTVNQENSDGDNFFVAPAATDMQGIFTFIGQQVCPALINVTPLPPPTTATINVITQVTGGSAVPGDFTMNVSATNPSQNSFAGSSSGIAITVDPGAYNITENAESGYTTSIGPTCSSANLGVGNIVAGENRTCVIANSVIPPPPPAPNLNFDPNSWREVPTAN